ncbi:MAG: hypothetical protein U1F70_02675 [Candidatus Competibacteraceae bacterium]
MQTMNMRIRWARLVSFIMVVSLLLFGTSSIQALQLEPSSMRKQPPANLPFLLKGTVELLGKAVSNLSVNLYEVQETHSHVVGKAVTDSQGQFFILRNDDGRQSPLYLIARGTENSPVALMAVVDLDKMASSHTRHIMINELTTVAAVWVAAQFLDGDMLTGNAVGLHNAIGNANNLIDVTTGDVAPLVMDGVNIQTTTLSILYSLGNLLGACAGGNDCGGLFQAATPPTGSPPTNTLQAALNIARNPWHNIETLFRLLPDQDSAYFKPILRYAPTAWTLSLIYTGGGLDAPGGVSIDAKGFIWTNNNFLVGSQSFLRQRGFSGLGVTKLAPNGKPLSPPFGFQGAGINGAGFGIAIDQRAHIWVGNFAGNSVSELDANARPANDVGYTANGGTNKVQGTVVDQRGNVWAANLGGNSVSFFPVGRPRDGVTFNSATYPKCGFNQPFGIAIDHNGHPWIANMGSSTIVKMVLDNPELCPEGTVDVGSAPQMIAIDSIGNLWITHFAKGYVTLYRPATSGKADYDAGGSLVGGWGIAVDGKDNVWIADFWGTRVVQLCGVPEDCPSQQHRVGDRISSSTGYGGAGGLQHMTSIAIDQAGNVLVTNNNNSQPLCDTAIPLDAPTSVNQEKQTMGCGGNGVLTFYGLAAPVGAPLIGPPVQP